MTKVCNDDGYIVYYEYEGLVGTAIYINDEIIYGLPNGRWKKYKVKNLDFTFYEDSEGNFWDKTFKSDFPYAQNTLDVEVLECAREYFNKQVDILENVKNQYNVNDLNVSIRCSFNNVYDKNYDDLEEKLDRINNLLAKLGDGQTNFDDDLPF